MKKTVLGDHHVCKEKWTIGDLITWVTVHNSQNAEFSKCKS